VEAHPRATPALYAAFGGIVHLAIAWALRHPLDAAPGWFDLTLPLALAAVSAATRSVRPATVVFALVWCPELAAILDLPRAWGALGVVLALVATRPKTAPVLLAVLTAPLALRTSDLGDPTALRAASLPDILLVTVDTVRADAGLLDGLTPTRAYAQAIAPAPWTLPSMLALFTGVPARESGQGVPTVGGWVGRTHPSLIGAFREAGYDTRAWVCNPHITADFSSGFNHFWHADDARAPLPTHVYDDLRRRITGQVEDLRHTRDARLEAAVRAAMDEPSSTPRFYWVHLLLPHEYTRDPAGPSPAGSAAAYAENVAATRDRIGRLVRPGWIVAVTSDHGEAFGEGGVTGHGHLNQDAELRVPLALFGVDPGQIDTQVGTVALLPTLARSVGLPLPGDLAQERVAVGTPRRSAALAIRVNGAYEADVSTAPAGPATPLDKDALEALGYTE
jgi:hypothetical protein